MSKARAIKIEVKYFLTYLAKILTVIFTVVIILVDLVMLICLYNNYKLVIQPAIDTVSIDDIYIDDSLPDLAEVPLPIVQSFIGNRWKFRVDTTLVNDDGWLGYTDYENKEIVVIDNKSVLHEFGHYLHWVINFPAETSEMYLADADNIRCLIGDYGTKNSREYFAECFSFWLSEDDPNIRDVFRILAPNTHSYFIKLEESGWGLKTDRIYIQLYNWENVDELNKYWEAEEQAWLSKTR